MEKHEASDKKDGHSNLGQTDGLPAEEKDIDYILEEVVGGGGLAQWLIILAHYPIGICSGLPNLLHMFAALEPRHRCFVPGCDDDVVDGAGDQDAFNVSWLEFAIPKSDESKEMLKMDEHFDPCHVHASLLPEAECSAAAFDNTTVGRCTKYIYDMSQFEETLTSKFDLVCDKENQQRFLGVVMMIGLMFGSFIGGYAGDKIGRKSTMLAAVLLIVPSVILGGFSPNYEVYAILRFVSCACLPCIWVCCHSLSLEVFGNRHRTKVIVVKDFVGPMSQIILAMIVYFVSNWKLLHVWTGVACSLCLPAFFFFPESIRWLAINGKVECAEKVLLEMARVNGRFVSDEQRAEIHAILNHVEKESMAEVGGGQSLTCLDMLKRGHLVTTMILLLAWVTCCVGSYTFVLNATDLHGTPLLNFVLSVLIDLPGTVILFFGLNFFSRKFSMFFCMIIMSICCIILALVPPDSGAIILVAYLLGKCFAGIAFLVIWLITAEMYPTNLRTQAVGTCSTISRIFGLVVPFVGKLTVIWKPLPMLLLGLPSIASAMLLYFLPETKSSKLPQNLNDFDHLDHKREPRGSIAA